MIVKDAPSTTVAVAGRLTVGARFVPPPELSVMVTVMLAEALSEPSLTVTLIVTSVFAVTSGAGEGDRLRCRCRSRR